MTNTKKGGGPKPAPTAPALPEGDLRDPAYRHRFIFGDEPPNPTRRETTLGDFLFFGAFMQR